MHINKAISKYVPITISFVSLFPKWFTKKLIKEIKNKKLAQKRYKTTRKIKYYKVFSERRIKDKKIIENMLHKLCWYIINVGNARTSKYLQIIRKLKSGIPATVHFNGRVAEEPIKLANLFAQKLWWSIQ